MEAELKIQAAVAVGMLRTVALARSAFDYISNALLAIHEADFEMTSHSQGLPNIADELLTSIHSITFACREVVELEFLVESTMMIISRWIEPNQTGLQGLPAAAWRVQVDELVGTVVLARQRLKQAAASCYRSGAVLDVATLGWSNLPPTVRNGWMRDGRRALLSAREYLNDSRDNLTKMCAAAVGAHNAAKALMDLL